VAGESELSGGGRVAVFVGAGLWLGQVANPAAHELIHRPGRGLCRLGALVYCWLLFGHHTSAHRLVHHRHAASAQDPNTARSGEGYYAFLVRAWAGSFRRGLAAENALRVRGKVGMHPYAVYMAIAVFCLGLGYAIAGTWGALAWAGLAAHAQSQLMLSDYVQHYGLVRAVKADGRLESVSARHSWNAPHWFSSAFMLNAPRHSDHHAHPARPYPALRLPEAADAPHLPWPLPLACMIALCPPLWKRAIRPHLKRWQ
jgi:alkane 1-monooxygenase